jgi:hypothetical protein
MAAGNLDGTRTTPMNTDIKYIIYPCSSVQSVYSASHPKSLNSYKNSLLETYLHGIVASSFNQGAIYESCGIQWQRTKRW